MTVGTILMCFLHKRDPKKEEGLQESSVGFYSLMVSLSNSVINPLCDRRLLLIIPLIAYSGLQQAFVWWVFFQLTFKTFRNVLPPEIKVWFGNMQFISNDGFQNAWIELHIKLSNLNDLELNQIQIQILLVTQACHLFKSRISNEF